MEKAMLGISLRNDKRVNPTDGPEELYNCDRQRNDHRPEKR